MSFGVDDAQCKTGPFSRIHKHNSTADVKSTLSLDSAKNQLPGNLHNFLETENSKANRPLTARSGESLRKELVDSDGHAKTWREAVFSFLEWVDDYDDLSAKLEKEGEEITIPLNHRFDEDRSKQEYSRLLDLERGLQDEYDDLHTAMISLTGSSRNLRGGWRCPVDHLMDIRRSEDAVLAALRRELEGREWEYAWIKEPHKSGYAHSHLAVFVDGFISKQTFQPVVDAHLRNCKVAGEDAHVLEECVTTGRVDPGGEADDDNINSIAYYLSEYISDSFQDPEEADLHVQQFNALLWATDSRRVGYSQGCYQYMDKGYELRTGDKYIRSPEPKGFELTAFEKDGELYEVEGDQERESHLTETSHLFPDILDPPNRPE